MTARAHHPFLDPVNPDRGERMAADLGGAADPPKQGIVLMGNGDMVHVPPPGSIPHQLMTQTRTEGTAATRDAQAYNSYGAANEGPHERAELLTNGQTSEEAYRDEKSDTVNLYG